MSFFKKILELFTINSKNDSVKYFPSKLQPTSAAGNVTTTYKDETAHSQVNPFNVIVVGVSYYQNALKKIFRDRNYDGIELITQAKLVPDNNNPHDANAVKVVIEGKTVGHLSRDNAFKWRIKMKNEGFYDAVDCQAKIKWDTEFIETGSYGVWIDVDLTISDSIPVSKENNIQQDSEFQEFLQDDGLSFLVEDFRIQDTTCTGMSVKLWIPKVKNPETVYIYDRSSPFGPLGVVPYKYTDIIAEHLMASMDYDARIIELSYNACKIKCRLISKEETDQREKDCKKSFKKELTKPYNPKKPITLMFPMKRKNGAKVGDKLSFKFEDIDSYGPYPCPWNINFLNKAGDTIGCFSDDRSIIQRILKAHFNSFLFDIEVLEIAKERSTAHKGYPTKLIITPYKNK